MENNSLIVMHVVTNLFGSLYCFQEIAEVDGFKLDFALKILSLLGGE